MPNLLYISPFCYVGTVFFTILLKVLVVKLTVTFGKLCSKLLFGGGKMSVLWSEISFNRDAPVEP